MYALTVIRAWLTLRPIKRWKEHRAKRRDEAAAAGGEYLYDEEQPMLKGKLTYASIATLAIGLVTTMIGVDMAPAEVDAIVTALATIGAVYGRYRATRT